MAKFLLFLIADYCVTPWESYVGVSRLARDASLSPRQASRYIASLIDAGELEHVRTGQREWVYRVLLPRDPAMTTDDRPESAMTPSDMPHSDRPESAMTPSDMPHSDRPERSGMTDLRSGMTDLRSGMTSSSLLIRNQRKRTKENEEADARTRDPIPLPSSVMTADQAWQLILQYLDGEVSSHERQTWRQRVRAGWSGPDILCLRGPASLVRLGRFTGCVRMAANQLDMGAVIEFSAIGA